MTVAIVCSSILAAMIFLLGFNVSRMRGVTAKRGGSQMPTDPADPLLIAQRAHGNAAEYVPTLMILFLLVGARSEAGWVAALIIAATVARIAHAVGMLTAGTLAAQSKPHIVGAMGTYVFGVALAVAAATTL